MNAYIRKRLWLLHTKIEGYIQHIYKHRLPLPDFRLLNALGEKPALMGESSHCFMCLKTKDDSPFVEEIKWVRKDKIKASGFLRVGFIT